ncbi:HAMP domain-containing protein [Dactylosporangium sp. NPDC048998]|uniref:HAMP domain-containing protein n=1 Tax=Dactylosporangium sp. NPDC048998 TaxID=3363976 RepID=UPI00371032AF
MNRATGGLFRRMVLATSVLLLIVGGAFGLLLISSAERNAATRVSTHAQEVFITADRIERVAIDMQTAQLEYTSTGDPRFLGAWQSGRVDLPLETARLVRTATNQAQRNQAQHITQTADSYVNLYSVPAMQAAQRGDPSARSEATLQEGNRRIDELQSDLVAFRVAEQNLIHADDVRADRMASREIIAVIVGMVGSVIVIGLVGGYQMRIMIQPIRRAAAMADRLAGGDFSTRIPETGKAEIGQLERSFNVMAATLAQFVDTQTALRRVATLVARDAPPAEVMQAVASELGGLIGTPSVRIVRYEPDGSGFIVAAWGEVDLEMPPGTRISLDGLNAAALVRQTGRPARMDDYANAPGPLAAHLREHGITAAVAVPINVEGRLWGCVAASMTDNRPPPPDAEARLLEYTDLIATAIANSQARADLVASRARFVFATDQARRRIERDLHDGVQQRLISLGLEVRRAEASVPPELPDLREQLGAVAAGLTGTVDDVREISRGVHPAILTEAGLRPALRVLARRCGVAVDLDIKLDGRLPEPVEVAAFYVAAEALTNAAKHARATHVSIGATVRDEQLHLTVSDDGVGGADPAHGSGLIGLTDRVEALGGTLVMHSPPGGGTRLSVRLPLEEGGPHAFPEGIGLMATPTARPETFP